VPIRLHFMNFMKERARKAKHVSSGMTSLTFVINVTEIHNNRGGMESKTRAEMVTMSVTIFGESARVLHDRNLEYRRPIPCAQEFSVFLTH
jgi:hypothetical protein